MSIDSVTGLPSYFNVYDTVTVGFIPVAISPPPPLSLLKMRISALWALEPGEEVGHKCEAQFTFRGPPGFEGPTPSTIPFAFDKQFYRVDAIVQGIPFSQSGTYYAESRVREVGQTQWKVQDFPLRVEMIQHQIDLTPLLPTPPPLG